jgi:alpha-tubulin suppressor-like RCC1 family protein
VVAVEAGGFHSLALDANGIIYAWGGNWVGQAAAPIFPTFVVGIAAGNTHSLALGFDGTVWAWGDNFYGQTNVPAGLTNIVEIVAGFSSSLALRADGTVVKWGSSSLVPAGLTNVVAIDTGWRDVALRADGTCVVWGSAGVVETNLPAGLVSLRSVASGGEHLLALKAAQVIAWGIGSAQTNVPALSNPIAIAAGDSHSLAAIRNLPPIANAQSVFGMASQDLLMTLTGADPTGDALSFRITTLPVKGQLYQCVNGLRGAIIAATNTFLSDTNGRVIFVPLPNEYATPYATFGFTAYDGEADSPPATATLSKRR